MDREKVLETIMNPNAEPYKPKKPIDIANDEIRLLKKELLELRKAIEPLIAERNKRLIEEERETPVVIEKSWWWG